MIPVQTFTLCTRPLACNIVSSTASLEKFLLHTLGLILLTHAFGWRAGVSPPMLMVLAGLLTHPQAHVRGAAAAGLKGLARCLPAAGSDILALAPLPSARNCCWPCTHFSSRYMM